MEFKVRQFTLDLLDFIAIHVQGSSQVSPLHRLCLFGTKTAYTADSPAPLAYADHMTRDR